LFFWNKAILVEGYFVLLAKSDFALSKKGKFQPHSGVPEPCAMAHGEEAELGFAQRSGGV